MQHQGLVVPSQKDVIIKQVFEPDLSQNDWLPNSMIAVTYLARDFADMNGARSGSVLIGESSLAEAFSRFVRDVWGVKTFLDSHRQELHELDRTDKLFNDIKEGVQRLGLRISADKPRKTRIAAVFALWFATFRPFQIDARTTTLSKEQQPLFMAEFILALTKTYLEQFGTISFGKPTKDATIRQQHIIHDLHCRALSQSPLELLYCSVFRPF